MDATPSRPSTRTSVLIAAAIAAALLLASAGAGFNRDSARAQAGDDRPDARDVAMAIHCGTGALDEDDPPEEAEQLEAAFNESLEAGYAVLDDGGEALDAVQAAIVVLEDEPLCNAGRGAVFNADAEHQLDASIMDGSDLRVGAVAAIENVKNPISAARLVMEETPHVLLTGEGADDFAAAQGLETVTQDYFGTPERYQSLLDAKEEDEAAAARRLESEGELGTVGAIAVDGDGDLAAATSTGGLTNKMVGRIGDSPIAGAGTWADRRVAVSATGTGEAYIRLAAARDIAALMQYRRLPVTRAAARVIEKVDELASGAVIALDRRGRLASPRTGTLKYGWITGDGDTTIRIFDED